MSSWEEGDMMQAERENDYTAWRGQMGPHMVQEHSQQAVWSMPVKAKAHLSAKGTEDEDSRLSCTESTFCGCPLPVRVLFKLVL